MKKTFLAVCAVAAGLLTMSSCGKIWDEFDAVHGEIDDLKTRVEALEAKLNTEVATINSKIDGLDAAYKLADAALAESIQNLTTKLDALDGELDGTVAYLTSEAGKIYAAIEDLKKADENLAKVDTEVLAALVGVNVTNVAKNAEGDVVITFADKSTITRKLWVPSTCASDLR